MQASADRGTTINCDAFSFVVASGFTFSGLALWSTPPWIALALFVQTGTMAVAVIGAQ